MKVCMIKNKFAFLSTNTYDEGYRLIETVLLSTTTKCLTDKKYSFPFPTWYFFNQWLCHFLWWWLLLLGIAYRLTCQLSTVFLDSLLWWSKHAPIQRGLKGQYPPPSKVILLDFLRNQQLDNTPTPTNHAWKIIGPYPEILRQSNHL